jgi:hypothetical protein
MLFKELGAVNTLQFKSGRIAGGIKRDFEMLKESGPSKDGCDGQLWRETSLDLEDMGSWNVQRNNMEIWIVGCPETPVVAS